MPSTYTVLRCHIVFATKHREKFIHSRWETQLHRFLGGCLRQSDCLPIEIGGTKDHVYLLTGFNPVHRLSDLVGDLKSASSRWIRNSLGIPNFRWQEGYAAVSVSAMEMEKLRIYIKGQREHHRRVSFLDEYRALLEKVGLELDERFLP